MNKRYSYAQQRKVFPKWKELVIARNDYANKSTQRYLQKKDKENT